MSAHVSWALSEDHLQGHREDRDEVGLGRGLAGMGDLASLCLSFPIHKIEAKMLDQHHSRFMSIIF